MYASNLDDCGLCRAIMKDGYMTKCDLFQGQLFFSQLFIPPLRDLRCKKLYPKGIEWITREVENE